MNNYATTKEKRKSSKIERFFRRFLRPKKEPNVLENRQSKAYRGSKCSKVFNTNKSYFSYKLVSLKKTQYKSYIFRLPTYEYKYIERTFNKSQLIGKIFTFEKKKYRIIKKV